ncbi:MAG TPA: ferritin-like domain-containing protein [Polyangiaceae bacterium]|nr:ferritin-like domain-containing protein [Polyangiaceae bacterium]
MTAVGGDESAGELAARVWSFRLGSELEAAQRFRALAPRLRAAGASEAIVGMAEQAAVDELRHAELCRQLVKHFGGAPPPEPQIALRWTAPGAAEGRERLLYEIVALSCVTETLSTALLGELVARATDPVCRQAMHSILCDEVKHSRLGWAFLAEEHARAVGDCVGPHLPAMLEATLGDELFREPGAPDPRLAQLAGLGSLERSDRLRVVHEALQSVIFPGLELFGIETAFGRRWLDAR